MIRLCMLGVFFGLSHHSWASNGAVEKAKAAAELEIKLENVSSLWRQGVRWLVNFESADPDFKYSKLTEFQVLTKSEQMRLEARLPKLKLLEQFIDLDRLSTDDSTLIKLRREVQEQTHSDPEQVRAAIHAFQDTEDRVRAESTLELGIREDILQQDEFLDQLFTINYRSVEYSIPASNKYPTNVWIRQPKEMTQTNYSVIRRIYRDLFLQESDVVYDLGSGFGRILLYGGCLFPKTRFKGVEIVKERAKESERISKNLGLTNVEIVADDVLNVDLSKGTVFYFFNPFPAIMDKVLSRLQKISVKKKITIVTTGRTSKDLMGRPWLKLKKTYDRNLMNLAIFESR